jgi:DNA-binding transcriptional regulator YiaG
MARRQLRRTILRVIICTSVAAQSIISDVMSIIKDVKVITGFQIRAARFALRLSAEHVARLAGVSLPTIQRFEQHDDVPPSRSSTLMDVKAALEAAGIEFIGTPDDGPGIRLRRPRSLGPSSS